MKIGINASFLRKSDSGIGQVTRNFILKLIESRPVGFEFVLYLEQPSGLVLPESFTEKVLKVPFYTRDDLVRKIIWEKFLLPSAIKKDGCEKFFSLYQSPTVIDGGKIPHLMLVHDVIWKVFPEYLNNFRKKIYYQLVEQGIKKADWLMTVSENSKTDIEKLLMIEKERISINLIDCDELFKQKASIEKDQKVLARLGINNRNYIFYFGGLDKRKNVDRLIEAYGLLWQNWEAQKDNFPSLVIGGKFYPHLVPLVCDLPSLISKTSEKYQIPKDFFLRLNFIEQDDLPAVYRGAKLFCFPSLYEGFGLPILEAFNSGVPVLAGNNSSLIEVADGAADLIDTSDVKLFSKEMKKILNDENLKTDLVAMGKRQATKFSWDHFVEKWLAKMTRL